MSALTPEGHSIAILTATLNAGATIGTLASSLASQSDKRFEWIVVDGGSTDETLKVLGSCGLEQLRIIRTHDFGIYDALNQGLAALRCTYYLVCGSDDVLFPNAVRAFRQAAACDADLIAAPVVSGGKVLNPRRGPAWLFGMAGVVASHSVGLLIRTDLHKRLGAYSKNLPIAADQLFVLKALQTGSRILYVTDVVGEYGRQGTSGHDPIGTITEIYRAQLRVGRAWPVQTALFLVRLVKNLIFNPRAR